VKEDNADFSPVIINYFKDKPSNGLQNVSECEICLG
jgi:hypothetical protein